MTGYEPRCSYTGPTLLTTTLTHSIFTHTHTHYKVTQTFLELLLPPGKWEWRGRVRIVLHQIEGMESTKSRKQKKSQKLRDLQVGSG